MCMEECLLLPRILIFQLRPLEKRPTPLQQLIGVRRIFALTKKRQPTEYAYQKPRSVARDDGR